MSADDPMLDGITRYDSDDYDVELPEKPDGIYVLFSDLLALLAAARAEAAEAAMQIGRQIEKDNHAAGLCEPSYTHGREYQQERLTNHDMHSGLACLTNYEQGYAAALSAARDAVVAQKVKWSIDYDTALDDALAAIDALKGEQE